MNIIKSLFSKFAEFMTAKLASGETNQMIKPGYGSGVRGSTNSKASTFDTDYLAAGALLRERINKQFPDRYFARAGTEANILRDYSGERAGAIDTSSAAIAVALREGATVKQAAEAGAASVGI